MIFNKEWTLFLDRDGVINRRISNDYVQNWADFHFLQGSLHAIQLLSQVFNRIIVVTNQAGIGKGIMTENQLLTIHEKMINAIENAGGRVDKVYFAPDHPQMPTLMRKPNIGMANQAKLDLPEINLMQSVMVGDSISDIQFGKNAGMMTVFVDGKGEDPSVEKPDWVFKSLLDFANYICKNEF